MKLYVLETSWGLYDEFSNNIVGVFDDPIVVDGKHIFTYRNFPCKNVLNPIKVIKDVFPNFKILNTSCKPGIIDVIDKPDITRFISLTPSDR